MRREILRGYTHRSSVPEIYTVLSNIKQPLKIENAKLEAFR